MATNYVDILLFAFPIEAFPCSGTNKGPIVKGPRAAVEPIMRWRTQFPGARTFREENLLVRTLTFLF